MKKFSKIFNDFFKSESIEVKNIFFYDENNGLEIVFLINELMFTNKFSDLYKQIRKDLPFINELKIKRQYNIEIEDKKRFLVKHINNILKFNCNLTKRVLSVLKSSDKDIKDNTLIFKTHDKNIMSKIKKDKLDTKIKNVLNNSFKIDINVKIVYEKIDENIDDFVKKRDDTVNDMLTKMRAQRKQIKKTKSNKKSKKKKNGQIYGRKIKNNLIKIEDISEEGEYVAFNAKVFDKDSRELRGGKVLIMLSVTDFSSSIGVKIFAKPNTAETILKHVDEGNWYKFEGNVRFDTFDKELVIFANKIDYGNNKDTLVRTDDSKQKRVELHMHTNMSAMDGLTDVKELVNRAKDWGHEAIAVTDHGVLQAFPDAMDVAGDDLKVIYGVEGYLYNDQTNLINRPDDSDLDQEFIIFDIETTGLNRIKDEITEIGAVKIRNKQIIERFSTFVKPDKKIPQKIVELTRITNEMVENERPISEVLPEFLDFIGDRPVVAHNAKFDISFIRREAINNDLEFDPVILDTLSLSRMLLKDIKRHRLKTVARHLKVDLEGHHRAINDASATALIFIKLLKRLEKREIFTLNGMNNLAKKELDYKNKDTYHIIILAKNKVGLKNLYKIVSKSNTETFYKKPRIPKSLLNEMREGLIIGSACEAGELFQAILDNESDSKLKRIAKFYDYLEVQPLGNNQFLLDKGIVESKKDLQEINKKIINLGKKLNKLVVATGDVHFLDKDDAKYRKMLMAGKGFKDADNQPPLYFKTTNEMLNDFDYLDNELAREIVIKNPNKIADKVDKILPVPNGTFPPRFEGSDEELRNMCYEKARSIYGKDLPEIVQKRLEIELDSIIDNGYSVMYIIAQKLVDKSLEDGYLVGSRGSVGSSFAATMSNITEVNPLPPHYVCPECKYSEFITDGSLGSGIDLDDKDCPECGHKLKKDGHDIPFEVFLGFGGGKEPDIDLNFAGVYQSKAHDYCEVLFGEGKTFKAGTIGTIASKTAYGYVSSYFEEREIQVRKKEIERLTQGCTGVKRTSGQHPGGIMVVPKDKDIYDFCPIQYPANDKSSGVLTTHFDYHSISGRLLKLDILGHDVPTMIRQLEDITGVNVFDISLDDSETMEIFRSTKPLNILDDDYPISLGSLGIPEFGTSFVRQMLKDTKPKTFSDLVRISGLSHGTDVWLNNAQELVRNGVVQIQDVISTRDDIMNYLIYNGLPSKEAFTIMEKVRKGKGLNDEQLKLMKENDIPQWYIDSCLKIKYMFPKAHAVAYVMMSFRIAYFKVFHPLAFYATFFATKVNDFDAEIACKGKEKVLEKMNELNNLDRMTQKEKNTYTILEIVLEYYARGLEFKNVDVYESHYKKFLIKDDKILPPLQALDGVGENAAKSVYNERENGEFISIQDLTDRTKLTKTSIEALKNQGSLGNMSELNQISMF
ncbi:MAG: PolC-type DNA polymerase III [Bacillota bacterium]